MIPDIVNSSHSVHKMSQWEKYNNLLKVSFFYSTVVTTQDEAQLSSLTDSNFSLTYSCKLWTNHLQTALESLTLEKPHEPGGEAALQDVFPAFQQEEHK